MRPPSAVPSARPNCAAESARNNPIDFGSIRTSRMLMVCSSGRTEYTSKYSQYGLTSVASRRGRYLEVTLSANLDNEQEQKWAGERTLNSPGVAQRRPRCQYPRVRRSAPVRARVCRQRWSSRRPQSGQSDPCRPTLQSTSGWGRPSRQLPSSRGHLTTFPGPLLKPHPARGAA